MFVKPGSLRVRSDEGPRYPWGGNVKVSRFQVSRFRTCKNENSRRKTLLDLLNLVNFGLGGLALDLSLKFSFLRTEQWTM